MPSEEKLKVQLYAASLMLKNEGPRQRVLSVLAEELRRLASEAERLADAAGDDPDSNPFRHPIPGFDT